MRRPLGLALFFGAFYLASLAVTMPAASVHGWAVARGWVPATLSGIDGTVWRGRAAAARIGTARVEGIAWTLRPTALFGGRLEFDVDARVAGGTLAARAGRTLAGATYARDVRLNAPVNALVMAAGEPDMGLTGRLDAAITRVRLREAPVPLVEGVVAVSGAGIGAPLDLEFGDLALDLAPGDGGAVVGTLRDGDGPLRAGGTLVVQANGAWRLQARLAARPGHDDLAQALAMLGRPGADGTVAVERTGILRLP